MLHRIADDLELDWAFVLLAEVDAYLAKVARLEELYPWRP